MRTSSAKSHPAARRQSAAPVAGGERWPLPVRAGICLIAASLAWIVVGSLLFGLFEIASGLFHTVFAVSLG